MLFAYAAFLVLIVKCDRNNHSHCQAAHWGWCESYENWQRTEGESPPAPPGPYRTLPDRDFGHLMPHSQAR
jgi:hypothetical protein